VSRHWASHPRRRWPPASTTSSTGPSVARPVSHCNLSAHQPVAEIVQAGEPISPRFCALSPPSDRLDRHVAFFSPFGALLNDAIRASHGRLSARIRSRPRWAPGDHPEGRIDSENARVSGRGPSASSGISPPTSTKARSSVPRTPGQNDGTISPPRRLETGDSPAIVEEVPRAPAQLRIRAR